MNAAVIPLFALPDIEGLLREELAGVPALAGRQPAGRALLVQACARNRELPLDTRHLGLVRMHATARGLGGDVICASHALPWEDDAFRLLIVQHVEEMMGDVAGFVDELARVLVPGGTLLWFGLNPWSPWFAWAHWQAQRGASLPRTVHAESARRRLLRQRLAPTELVYLGSCWPQRGERSAIHRHALLTHLRAAYLISATKQHAALTPLGMRRPRKRRAMQPQLVASSRRACA